MHSNGVAQVIPSQYELIITRQNEAPQFHSLDKTMLMIGREANNDIPIVGQAVSRHHARIEQIGGMWHVIDLGSTNGTFLSGERLPANVSQVWQAGHPIQIGAFTLQWQSTTMVQSDQTLVLMPGELNIDVNEISTEDTHDIVPDKALSVLLNATEIELHPDETVEVKLGVLSTSSLNKQIDLSIVGIPESWYELSHQTMRLAPKKHRSTTIRFRLPKGHTIQGGRHEFEVQLRNTHHPNYLTRVSGTLIIPSLSDFAIRTRQSGINNAVQFQVQLENIGNTVETYKLKRRGSKRAVSISGDVWEVSLLPGSSCWLSYQLKADTRPIFGPDQVKPFELVATSNLNQEKGVKGTLTVTPVLPMVPIVTALVILAALVVAFGILNM
ncbi:MAG: FHA domain-containing protein [Candidatus Promineifilaceae bacterium]